VGLATLVIGLLGVILSHSIALTLLFGVITGLGHGAVDIGVSLFIALAFEKAGVAALNFTNIFFGLGAIAGPAAASFALAHGGTALPALWGVVGIAVIAFVFAMLTRAPAQAHGSAHTAPVAVPGDWWRSSLIALLGGLFLLYVGLENGLGSWTAVLAQRVAGQSLATGALVAAGFWFALTAGRVVGSILGTRMTGRRLLILCAVGAVGAAMLLLASPLHPAFLIAGITVFGLSFGPIYPTAVALTTARFPHTPGRATSLVTSLGSLGGVMIPWLQGWLLTQVSPWMSILFVAALVVGMGGLILSVSTGATRSPIPFP